ncbi:MAG: Nif11-like leader peptide family natural product precursor [Cyanobacteria bacterium M_surface_7_m2_040]|nr:Nif11-like leader peptide family natural product precursor [Cyanobacteria bacterium K_Offshore_0m_m2_072]MBM5809568.1 Nif11-like leader peptide family natural product precursor [Cyanobacteria bacterium M_surface_9_m1_291]MBM5827483.1 Nif11-like leader peptide family natural product precursor [Cyanobacteria bacterium M_surface_7_m2_040]
MANPSLEAFLKQVKADPALLNQLQQCPNLDAIADLGAHKGFEFSGVDLVRHQAEATLRLSDDELRAAAAGVSLDGHLWLMQIVWS